MRITISGLPGSGTTSLARHLSSEHSYALISAGEVFRQMASERGMSLAEFGALAERDPAIDHLIDDRQRETSLQKDDIIAEGRLSGWMIHEADLKIWLYAPLACRVRRILVRDQITDEREALRTTEERERCEAERYRTYYNIDIRDLTRYDLVLNSERWSVDQLGAIVNTALAFISKSSA